MRSRTEVIKHYTGTRPERVGFHLSNTCLYVEVVVLCNYHECDNAVLGKSPFEATKTGKMIIIVNIEVN